MMTSAIKDDIRIEAGLSHAYEALTRQAGCRGWWDAVGEVDEVETGTGQPWSRR